MTATRGSAAPTAMADGIAYVARFSRTERALHWVHAPAFFALLGTGLVLYVPQLSEAVGRRDLVKALHLYVAIAWAVAIAVVLLSGDRRTLRETRRQIERLDRDDGRWLLGWPAPQRRFNAGQKVHAILQAALAVLFAVSGSLLWLGERDTNLRFAGTIVLHDAATYAATALVAGHLYLAVIAPATRPALRGMLRGTVRADWAALHHPKWLGGLSAAVPGSWPRPGVRRVLIGTATLVALTAIYAAVRPEPHPAQPRRLAFSPAPRAPDALARGQALARRAEDLAATGRLDDALATYARAVDTLPGAADVRAAYGAALAERGQVSEGIRQLRAATRLDPSSAIAHLYLGALLAHSGSTQAGRRELRAAIRIDPVGATAREAQALLRRRR
jgi:formate dehydrogenase subunit gamma